MEQRLNEIDDLFSMFHDFEIVGIQLENEVLRLEILLPWSEMWGIEDYKMTFQFKGCSLLVCHYFKRIATNLVKWEKGVHYPTQEYKTSDFEQIEKLELSIQSHDFEKPDKFILYCQSSTSGGNEIGQIDFARIEMKARDYKILDNKNKVISIDKMKEWATDWWNSIQKMWDEQ